MPRCLKVDRLAEVWGVRKTARSVSAGGQRCYSQIQPPISVKGVVCHTRIQTVLLQLVILCQQSPQAFSPLTFSLCHTQTNKKPECSSAKPAPSPTPSTCSLRPLVSFQLCWCSFNIPSIGFCDSNGSSGIPLKINLCATLQVFLLQLHSTIKNTSLSLNPSHLQLLTLEIGPDLLRPCSRVWTWKRFHGAWQENSSQDPFNGLHFPSTLSAAGSNHDGIKITCGRPASSKQQLRDPLHSSRNESLKMHLCHEDSFSLSALIDYELFSRRAGLVASPVCYWLTCSRFFFVVGEKKEKKAEL